MQQTSIFVSSSSLKQKKDFTDLQEIILHFKLKLLSKDGGDITLHYCQLQIHREAIQILAETKGQIPQSFNEALREIKQRDAKLLENEAKLVEKDAVIKQRNEKLLAVVKERDALLREKEEMFA